METMSSDHDANLEVRVRHLLWSIRVQCQNSTRKKFRHTLIQIIFTPAIRHLWRILQASWIRRLPKSLSTLTSFPTDCR